MRASLALIPANRSHDSLSQAETRAGAHSPRHLVHSRRLARPIALARTWDSLVNMKLKAPWEDRDPNPVFLLLCLQTPLKSVRICPPRGRPAARGGEERAHRGQPRLAGRWHPRPCSLSSPPVFPHHPPRSGA